MTTITDLKKRQRRTLRLRKKQVDVSEVPQEDNRWVERLEDSLNVIRESRGSGKDDASLEIVEDLISNVVVLAESQSQHIQRSNRQSSLVSEMPKIDVEREPEFETACINLMSKSEYIASSIGIASESRRYNEVIELCKNSLLEILDFTEEHLFGLGDAILRELNVTYSNAKEFEKAVDYQVWNAIRRFMGLSANTKLEFDETHDQLRESYINLVDQVTSTASSRFATPQLADEIAESGEILVNQLRRVW